MASEILPSVVTGLSFVTTCAIGGVLAPLVARKPQDRPANDNEALDLTELTLMGFAAMMVVGIVGTALWLLSLWP